MPHPALLTDRLPHPICKQAGTQMKEEEEAPLQFVKLVFIEGQVAQYLDRFKMIFQDFLRAALGTYMPH